MRKKKIDHTRYETQEYWNQLLSDQGLSVDTGRDPRMVYVGSSQTLSIISDLERTRHEHGTAAKPQNE